MVFSDYSKHFESKSIENHHILPKSLFPEYELCLVNQVKVPVRIHFVLHWILAKMLPNNKSMLFAYRLMAQERIGVKKHRKFDEASKIKFVKYMKIRMTGVPPWKNLGTSEVTKNYWILAKPAYKIYRENLWIGDIRLANELAKEHTNLPGRKIFKNMIKKFRSGWNPNEDLDWIEFFNSKGEDNVNTTL